MTDAEIHALLSRLYAALNATNAALSAAVAVQETHDKRLHELEDWEYRNGERITMLEAAKLIGEAPFLPPPEKLN